MHETLDCNHVSLAIVSAQGNKVMYIAYPPVDRQLSGQLA